MRPVSPPAAAAPDPLQLQGLAQQQQGLAQQQQQQQPHTLPEQVRQFAEAHRVIVIDAVRTDFARHAAALLASAPDLLAPDSSSTCYNDHGSNAAAYTVARDGDGGDAADHTGAASRLLPGSSSVSAVADLVSAGLCGLQQCSTELQQYGAGLQERVLGSLLGGQAAAWGHNQPLWVSEAAQGVLDASPHLAAESKRQAARMVALLSAYALHDPGTGYSQG